MWACFQIIVLDIRMNTDEVEVYFFFGYFPSINV